MLAGTGTEQPFVDILCWQVHSTKQPHVDTLCWQAVCTCIKALEWPPADILCWQVHTQTPKGARCYVT